jgi:hypothetical protein
MLSCNQVEESRDFDYWTHHFSKCMRTYGQVRARAHAMPGVTRARRAPPRRALPRLNAAP